MGQAKEDQLESSSLEGCCCGPLFHKESRGISQVSQERCEEGREEKRWGREGEGQRWGRMEGWGRRWEREIDGGDQERGVRGIGRK